MQWVLLSYRLPREPSTPRITLWRRLKKLGVAQIGDGLVALPLDARSREQFEWLADDVAEAGGEAIVWIGTVASAAQQQELVASMKAAVAGDYRRVIESVESVPAGASPWERKRTLGRLRREMRAVRARDYFSPMEREEAQHAVERFAAAVEEPVA